MQTQPSLGLGSEELISNASLAGVNGDARRRLLNAQNGVTSLLGAERLWEQGFKGAKVKMGVFDTGIRADHPHVKNIRYKRQQANAWCASDAVQSGCLFLSGESVHAWCVLVARAFCQPGNSSSRSSGAV